MLRKIQLAFNAQYFRHDNAMLMMNGHNEVETVFKIAFLNPFEKLILAVAFPKSWCNFTFAAPE